MAKENTAFLYGVATSTPVIKVNKENEFINARITLTTIRRTFEKDLILSGKTKYSKVIIYTKNKSMVEHIYESNIHPGDMIFIKGSLCTMPSKKRFICPHCGNEIIVPGTTSVFVEPIYIKKCETNNTEKEAQALLDEAYEISNMLFIYGYLCRSPEYYFNNNKRECSFQIASNRKRRIEEMNETTDYPWVRCLGNIADEANKILQVGSEIYIHGNIQRRETVRQVPCVRCGYVPVKDSAVEIVPYSIEYGKNCNTEILRKDGAEDAFE